MIAGVRAYAVSHVKNFAPELPAFGVIAGVNPTAVQWESLALGKPPNWSRFSLCQVSMSLKLAHSQTPDSSFLPNQLEWWPFWIRFTHWVWLTSTRRYSWNIQRDWSRNTIIFKNPNNHGEIGDAGPPFLWADQKCCPGSIMCTSGLPLLEHTLAIQRYSGPDCRLKWEI